MNEQEETTALQSDMNMGLVSKQTAQEKRGYDHEQEEERMEEEEKSTQDAGGLLLSNFFRNGGNAPRKQPAESINNGELPA